MSLLRKFTSTDFTMKSFFSNVCWHVCFETGFYRKFSSTDFTIKSFLSSVCSHVTFETGIVGKFNPKDLTMKWFLSSVCWHVCFEIGITGKLSFTDLTRRIFSPVCVDICLLRFPFCENFAPQISQWKGFSPGWIDMWDRNWGKIWLHRFHKE